MDVFIAIGKSYKIKNKMKKTYNAQGSKYDRLVRVINLSNDETTIVEFGQSGLSRDDPNYSRFRVSCISTKLQKTIEEMVL